MKPLISHHLLLCATATKSKCCNPAIGQKSWIRLKEIINELQLENPLRPEGIVLRSKVDCLRICSEGPILLVWPDGIWYKNVTPELIDLIVKNHIEEGNPLVNAIIKKTPLKKLYKCSVDKF